MSGVSMVENLITLGMLTLLQAVLGFDNLVYISIESKRVSAEKQAFVRHLGIGVAIVLRILLLLIVVKAVEYFQNPLFTIHLGQWVTGEFSVHSAIVLVGGAFIIYTATKEISHMLVIHDVSHDVHAKQMSSVSRTVAWIVVMNLVFSFDSILSALALTNVFWVMAAAIIVSGLMMIWLADHVSVFLKKTECMKFLVCLSYSSSGSCYFPKEAIWQTCTCSVTSSSRWLRARSTS